MKTSRGVRVAAWSVALTVAAAAVATPAFAEGKPYSASFNDANPGFSSHAWTDHQKDHNSTVIKWSSCYLTNRTKPSTVQVSLWDQHGVLPDALVGSYRTLGACGTSSWAYSTKSWTLRDSTFFWEFGKINGKTGVTYLNGNSKATF